MGILATILKGGIADPFTWELPDALGAKLWAEQEAAIAKGLTHRYIRRTGSPGHYRYTYHAAHGGGVDHERHLVEGSKLRTGGGHYEIVKDHGDGRVTVKHDETGETKTMTKKELAAHLREHHKAALDAHARSRALPGHIRRLAPGSEARKKAEAEHAAEPSLHGDAAHHKAAAEWWRRHPDNSAPNNPDGTENALKTRARGMAYNHEQRAIDPTTPWGHAAAQKESKPKPTPHGGLDVSSIAEMADRYRVKEAALTPPRIDALMDGAAFTDKEKAGLRTLAAKIRATAETHADEREFAGQIEKVTGKAEPEAKPAAAEGAKGEAPNDTVKAILSKTREKHISDEIAAMRARRQVIVNEALANIEREFIPKKPLPVGISKLQALQAKERPSRDEKMLLMRHRLAVSSRDTDTRNDELAHGRVYDALAEKYGKATRKGGPLASIMKAACATPTLSTAEAKAVTLSRIDSRLRWACQPGKAGVDCPAPMNPPTSEPESDAEIANRIAEDIIGELSYSPSSITGVRAVGGVEALPGVILGRIPAMRAKLAAEATRRATNPGPLASILQMARVA